MPRRANTDSTEAPTSKAQPETLVVGNERRSGRKRAQKPSTNEPEIPTQPKPPKRARTLAPKGPSEPAVPAPDEHPAVPKQRKKRRTKAEMDAVREEAAAKKLAIENGKNRLAEIGEEAERRLEIMNLEDARKKVASDAHLVRRISGMVVREEEGEYIGIDEVSSTDENESSSETLGTVSLSSDKW